MTLIFMISRKTKGTVMTIHYRTFAFIMAGFDIFRD